MTKFAKLFLVVVCAFSFSLKALAQEEEAITGGPDRREINPLPAPLTSPAEVAPEKPNPVTQRAWFGAHLAAGFPTVAQVGLDFLNASEHFGFSIRGGNIQRTFDSVDSSMQNLEAQFRYHPYSTAFFYGVSLGRRSAKVEKRGTVSGQSVVFYGEGSSEYITPQVGWVWMFNNGLNIGFELGYLLPVNHKDEFSTTANSNLQNEYSYQSLANTVKDQADYLTKEALPHFTLIRLGWSY